MADGDRVTVLTVAVPERQEMLNECIASVRAQTHPPAEHLISFDYGREGCVPHMNRLVRAVSGDWVALLADDDLFLPHHLQTLAGMSDNADIVYSYCRVIGRDWNPNSAFDPERLRRENYIPSTSIIRTSLIRTLDGWRTGANGWEDWEFWLRALAIGARFVCVPEVTWVYRFWGGNISWRGGP